MGSYDVNERFMYLLGGDGWCTCSICCVVLSGGNLFANRNAPSACCEQMLDILIETL